MVFGTNDQFRPYQKDISSLYDIHRDTLECKHPIRPSPTKCIPYRKNYDRSLYAQFHSTLRIDIDRIMLLDPAVLNQTHNFRQDFGNLSDPSIGNALEILLYSGNRNSGIEVIISKLKFQPILMSILLVPVTPS